MFAKTRFLFYQIERFITRLKDSYGKISIDGKMNLNKLSDEDLNKVKQVMNHSFEKNRLKPGDDGFEYDKQVDFGPVEEDDNDWDEESDVELDVSPTPRAVKKMDTIIPEPVSTLKDLPPLVNEKKIAVDEEVESVSEVDDFDGDIDDLLDDLDDEKDKNKTVVTKINTLPPLNAKSLPPISFGKVEEVEENKKLEVRVEKKVQQEEEEEEVLTEEIEQLSDDNDVDMNEEELLNAIMDKKKDVPIANSGMVVLSPEVKAKNEDDNYGYDDDFGAGDTDEEDEVDFNNKGKEKAKESEIKEEDLEDVSSIEEEIVFSDDGLDFDDEDNGNKTKDDDAF